MKDFTNLVNNIDEIDDNFVMINSRIIEFGKSTNFEHIDFGLLDRYYDVLNDYILFLNDQKTDIKNNLSKSNTEYQAYKELVDIRINGLLKRLETNIKKISKIIKLKPKIVKKDNIDNIFTSSAQMDSLDRLTKEFHVEMNLYKNFQEKLGIIVKLDDKIEKDIEENNTDEDIMMIEKSFINDYITLFDDILEIKMVRYRELLSRKYPFFKGIQNEENYNNLFFEIFKKEYSVGLEMGDTDFNRDYKEYKHFIIDLDFLFDIADFCTDFDKLSKRAEKYNLSKFVLIFKEVRLKLINNVLNNKEFDLYKVLLYINKNIGIDKLRVMLLYIQILSKLLDNFDKIGKISFTSINRYYNSGFVEFFKSNITGNNIIKKFLEEYTLDINSYLNQKSINIKNILKNYDVFTAYEKETNDIYNAIIKNNNIITNYYYPSTSLKKLKNNINNNLEFYKEFHTIEQLIAYYNQSLTKNYNKKRSEYLARKVASEAAREARYKSSSRSSSSSNSSSRSSPSYSSSSSSWSSSSSSGSSSYSSSGSSSW